MAMRVPRISAALMLAVAMEATVWPQQAGGPQIITTSVPNGSVGTAYSAQIASNLSGTAGPATWSIVGGNLPPGISLTGASGPTATISGTPTLAGPYLFTILVTQMVDTGQFRSVEARFQHFDRRGHFAVGHHADLCRSAELAAGGAGGLSEHNFGDGTVQRDSNLHDGSSRQLAGRVAGQRNHQHGHSHGVEYFH